MTTNLIQFSKEEIDKVWPLAKELVHKACIRAGGFISEEHIKEHCKQGTMQLWMAVTDANEILCVGVTEIRDYPNYKVCDAKIVTGKRYKEWFDQIDKVAEWAKEQGCKKMELFARPGWEKVMKPKGYVKTHVQIEKIL